MKAYVAVGSNLGDSPSTITKAICCLRLVPGVSVTRISPLYRTEPVGGTPRQPSFLNGVLELRTRLFPQDVLTHLLRIELELGRVRREKWGPRIIDLDLLTYGQMKTQRRRLILPHPRYHKRRFVLVPFCDLAPRYIHPRLQQQNRTLLRKLTPLGQRVTIASLWNGTRFIPSKSRKKTKSRS